MYLQSMNADELREAVVIQGNTIELLEARVEVLEELLLSVCEENVYVTDEDRAHHNEAIDAAVEQRLYERQTQL